VTLHVGLGTFNPVEEDLSKHKMDSEELKITQAACDVNDAKERKTYLYQGTTSMRAVESSLHMER
jgi:S-adenosylmethionine:tRNA ribosyltransferase-isomerase